MKYSKLIIILAFFTLYFSATAQKCIEMGLYENSKIKRIEKTDDQPTIKVYFPEKSIGIAVIVCPGGGYSYEELKKEGSAFAPWFNQQGIALIVLKYSLPEGRSELPLADAEQAMRLIRLNADKWEINKDKIGIMGCSAGGHLASTLATHFHSDTRPAFQILVYPVITMDKAFTHLGSRNKLLGTNPTNKMIKLYSNELQVTVQTPPAFIVLSNDDKTVPSTNSVYYYLALQKKSISAELHIYPTGGHGWANNEKFKYQSDWLMELKRWLANVVC